MVLFVSDLNLAGIPLVKTSFNNEKSIKMSQITIDARMIGRFTRNKEYCHLKGSLWISMLKIDLCSVIKAIDIDSEIKKVFRQLRQKRFSKNATITKKF